MKTAIFDVDVLGTSLRFRVKHGSLPSQVVVVLPDNVEVFESENSTIQGSTKASFLESWRESGFPPRRLTEETIVRILEERGGSVKIREEDWNIYDEIAARLGVSFEARQRLTKGTGEPAWRPEVGFCRKNLEQSGALSPTDKSGRGVWALMTK